jgi:hypothetical protein
MVSFVVYIAVKGQSLGWAGNHTQVASFAYFGIDHYCSSDFCHFSILFVVINFSLLGDKCNHPAFDYT